MVLDELIIRRLSSGRSACSIKTCLGRCKELVDEGRAPRAVRCRRTLPQGSGHGCYTNCARDLRMLCGVREYSE
jgi:hypothetical protein